MTDHLPHIPLRRFSALAVLAVVLAVPAAAHGAKAPTVEIGLGEHAIAVAGAGDLGRGAIRLHIVSDGLQKPRTVAVIELARGVSRADVDAAHAERYGRLVAGGGVSRGRDYTTTIDARAREHVVVDLTAEDSAKASFEVGKHPSGARGPRSAASVSLRDTAIVAPRSLPRAGIVRIANRGGIAHQLTAFRIKHGVSTAQAVRALRNGHPDRIGSATVLAGDVSAGTVNRVEVELRAGRYVLASLHNPLTAGGGPDILRGLVAVTKVH